MEATQQAPQPPKAKIEILKEFDPTWETNVDIDLYHSDETSVSFTGLKVLEDQSPLHFYDQIVLQNKKEETDALRIGKIAHMALLEPKVFKERYIVMPPFTGFTKDGRETTSANCLEVQDKKAAWMKNQHPKAVICSQDDIEMLNGIIHSISQHKVARNLLMEGVAEGTGYFRDPRTGIKCRTRPDFVTQKGAKLFITEFKTARLSNKEFFKRQISNLKYHAQIMFQSHGLEQIFGQQIEGRLFLAAEKIRPYAIALYSPDQFMIDDGKYYVRRALDKLKNCIETNKWPSYQEGLVEDINLPPWGGFIDE